ncbi:MAG TPA: addiction module protein [Kofleriaceae bacterium]|nr:addiction module protein [Kofleriaceae bacterium]
MSDQPRHLFEEALRLPLAERADLATRLLRSLDDEERELPLDEVDRRWAEEITRRAERAVRGESVGHDAEDVLRSIEAKLEAKPLRR